MDISYTLYYVLMNDLRSLVKARYKERYGAYWKYVYVDLTHIEDVERDMRIPLPNRTVAEITFVSEIYSLLFGNQESKYKIYITEDGRFEINFPNEFLAEVMTEWLLIVLSRYRLNN